MSFKKDGKAVSLGVVKMPVKPEVKPVKKDVKPPKQVK
jgi:hypothetical protein